MVFICIYVNVTAFCIVFLTYTVNLGSLCLLYTILLILDHEKYIFAPCQLIFSASSARTMLITCHFALG